MVTVAVYDYASDSERDPCLSALQAQTLTDLELLVQGEGEDSVSFRNKALLEAKGEYIAFVSANSRYTFPQALEKLTLTAQVEGASVVIGKTGTSNGAAGCDRDRLKWGYERFVGSREISTDGVDLSGALLDTAFLRQGGLKFHDFGLAAELDFLSRAIQRAKRVYVIGREISTVVDSFSLVPIDRNARLEPLVSFVIPVYNAAALVARCVTSVLSIPVRNIEVICVNDGSTDESLQRLHELSEGDSRIKVLTQENAGQGSARNLGIQSARGRFVQFVDADDWIDSSMYPAVLKPFFDHPDLDFVQFSGEVAFDFDPTERQREWGAQIFKTSLSPGLHESGMDLLVSTVVCNKVYTRAFLTENEILFPERTKQEDEAFSFFVFARMKRMFFIDEPWYKYVRTESGTMSTQESRAQISVIPDCYRVFRFIGEFLEKESFPWLFGYYFKRVIGATTRFNGTPIEEKCRDLAAELLQAHNFGMLSELMVATDNAEWLQDLGHDLFGRTLPKSDLLTSARPGWRMPKAQEKPAASASPRMTYIVLLDGAEQVSPRALLSLAVQSFSDIEVICVATSGNRAARQAADWFCRRDARFSFRTVGGATLCAEDINPQIRDALSVARGDYVAILPGKDFVNSRHAQSCADAMDGQDIILVPDEYFDVSIGKPIEQYWMYQKHALDFPKATSWTISDCSKRVINPDNCNHVYRHEFLRESLMGEDCPQLGEGVMTAWLFHKTVLAKRFGVAHGAVCHIRLGRLNSTFSATREEWLSRRAQQVHDLICLATSPTVLKQTLAKRTRYLAFAFEKILYLVEKEPEMSAVLEDAIRQIPSESAQVISMTQPAIWKRVVNLCVSRKNPSPNDLPHRYSASFDKINLARQEITPDTIIVISFLLDASAECIDSWSLFVFLRTQGIPAKYVIPKATRYYGEVVSRSEWLPDVIALTGSDLGRSYEIADRLLPFLYRTKAIVMEDAYLPPGLFHGLKKLSRLLLVFLDHGSFYIWFNRISQRMFSRFDGINVAGSIERDMIEAWYRRNHIAPPVGFIEAGCPRYDLLPQTPQAASSADRTLLFSLTWRPEFTSLDKLKQSYYFRRLVAVLNSPRLRALSDKGVTIALVAHHAMRRTLEGIDLNEVLCPNGGICVVGATEVSSALRKASCLVTDMSSVAFDFLYQGKPVVFWLPDADDYKLSCISRSKLDCAQEQLARFDFAKTEEALLTQIESLISRDFKIGEEERKFAEEFFAHRGTARQDLLKGINSLWDLRFARAEGSLP